MDNETLGMECRSARADADELAADRARLQGELVAMAAALHDAQVRPAGSPSALRAAREGYLLPWALQELITHCMHLAVGLWQVHALSPCRTSPPACPLTPPLHLDGLHET